MYSRGVRAITKVGGGEIDVNAHAGQKSGTTCQFCCVINRDMAD